ncbi:12216_t:CDS:2 [Entrophospora sp. SA101]|nr:12212_t:CDS:2 [Entrophospora sp. SA101]CAJ0749196.1 12216_t:CDS:2 [Entrophospora sp. SA101]CAJ0837216.1 3318_t:CDS:2 [Entrophospora sp. SA101]
MAENKFIKSNLEQNIKTPPYISFDKQKLTITYLRNPLPEELNKGHAQNLTLQDFLVRYSYLKKRPIGWISGLDHAGIATQKKIESLNLPKKLGLLVDYQSTKFTLDLTIQKQVKQAFIQLYQDGLIYHPQLKSVVSDIEVEHQPTKSKLYYLKYPLLNSNDYLLVATSRPETVFTDVALFVNPNDQRYQKYIGQQVQHLITKKPIPILTDESIIMDFGTGVLKCTPGHDFFDYQLGKKYNLPLISCYNEKGVFNNLTGK